jgi:hypothetical protein
MAEPRPLDRDAVAPDADAERKKRQRGKNIATLVVLLALVVLFYALTMVKMKGGG